MREGGREGGEGNCLKSVLNLHGREGRGVLLISSMGGGGMNLFWNNPSPADIPAVLLRFFREFVRANKKFVVKMVETSYLFAANFFANQAHCQILARLL